MLIQAEWEDRENRKIERYTRTARFRYWAGVEEVDFTTRRGLDKTQLLRLADCSFIKKKENLLITGPTGVGKSYIASALGHQACMQGYRTLYFNAQNLFPQLNIFKADGSYLKQISRIERHDLLILDDFGPTDFGFSLNATRGPCDSREIAEEKLNKALESKPNRVCTVLPVYTIEK